MWKMLVATISSIGLLIGSWDSFAQDGTPHLYSVMVMPKKLAKLLGDNGFSVARVRGAIAWGEGGHNYYFLPLEDKGGGCSIVEVSEKTMSVKVLDSYGLCKVASPPKLMKLTGDDGMGIVVKLNLHSNGMSDVSVVQTNAYLYVGEASDLCRNDDAGNFSDGTRVPDSIIKFGPSDCK